MIMGFIQSFTYAEIAGMFGSKSGGASIYGATAWLQIFEVHRAPVGVVQLVRVVAGTIARQRHCGGLHRFNMLRALACVRLQQSPDRSLAWLTDGRH